MEGERKGREDGEGGKDYSTCNGPAVVEMKLE